ncbi:hypothetical protein YH65_01380 [Sulfurovum lithotrophicum]|uniref:Uncharacterized protein n=1 Tax=Sulfurovum lithotrophicum TaxID=206403 RepID=A0A7U4RPW0_9BACT|nr:hypothetical protein [Sulfurovum lithotrophicum]AKF24195.1 hypothetical protein YH65_01380 [Sulfurovum lithotrophicum]
MKKKPVKNATMFNMKGILILIAFGVWINLMMGIKENYETLKDAIYALSGNTLLVITVTYVILVIIGIFVETKDTDRFS